MSDPDCPPLSVCPELSPTVGLPVVTPEAPVTAVLPLTCAPSETVEARFCNEVAVAFESMVIPSAVPVRAPVRDALRLPVRVPRPVLL